MKQINHSHWEELHEAAQMVMDEIMEMLLEGVTITLSPPLERLHKILKEMKEEH